MPKLITGAQKSIGKYEFDRKRSTWYQKWLNLYWKWSKEIKKVIIYRLFWYKSTFLIFELTFLILYLTYFDLLDQIDQKWSNFINKWSKINQNWSKSRSMIQFCHQILNQTENDDQIWTAWNPNCWWFDLEALVA